MTATRFQTTMTIPEAVERATPVAIELIEKGAPASIACHFAAAFTFFIEQNLEVFKEELSSRPKDEVMEEALHAFQRMMTDWVARKCR